MSKELLANQDAASAEPEFADSTSDGGAAVAVAPAKKPAKTKNKPKQLPPYKVLLHNDDVNSFDHVILSILKLTTLTMETAVIKTLEAHEMGLSMLLVTHKERAELYQEQFTSVKLTVTIEPDGE